MVEGWTRWSARHERRRRAKLQLAQRRGDRSARAMWLLPRFLGGELRSASYRYDLPLTVTQDDEVRVMADRGDRRSVHGYRVTWLVPITLARLCAPKLPTFPPVYDETVPQLSPLYVPVESPVAAIPSSRLVEPLDNDDDDGSLRRIAGDKADIDMWHNATATYLDELGSTQRDVIGYWRAHGRKLPVYGFKRRAFRRWRDFLESAHQRIVAASDAYRPVFDRVTELAAETDTAYDTLTSQYRRLHEWEGRPIWRLRPLGDGFVITRTDVDDVPDPTQSGEPIRDVYQAAWAKRHDDLCPIDWHEPSIAKSDDELEARFREHREIGLTRSGRPLINGPPVLFTRWSDDHVDFDFWSISDRDRLARDVQRRGL